MGQICDQEAADQHRSCCKSDPVMRTLGLVFMIRCVQISAVASRIWPIMPTNRFVSLHNRFRTAALHNQFIHNQCERARHDRLRWLAVASTHISSSSVMKAEEREFTILHIQKKGYQYLETSRCHSFWFYIYYSM
jgi:hypothetical protein